jgi:hypothetical protein
LPCEFKQFSQRRGERLQGLEEGKISGNFTASFREAGLKPRQYVCFTAGTNGHLEKRDVVHPENRPTNLDSLCPNNWQPDRLRRNESQQALCRSGSPIVAQWSRSSPLGGLGLSPPSFNSLKPARLSISFNRGSPQLDIKLLTTC